MESQKITVEKTLPDIKLALCNPQWPLRATKPNWFHLGSEQAQESKAMEKYCLKYSLLESGKLVGSLCEGKKGQDSEDQDLTNYKHFINDL